MAALIAMAVFLVREAMPSIRHYGLFSFLTSSRWAPSEASTASTHPNPYGILQFVYGTVLTSFIAMLLAVPVAVAVGLFLTDIAPRGIRRPLIYIVDLLAAVPSVVYGFWGIFALMPQMRGVASFIEDTLGAIPGNGPVFAGPSSGPPISSPGSCSRS